MGGSNNTFYQFKFPDSIKPEEAYINSVYHTKAHSMTCFVIPG